MTGFRRHALLVLALIVPAAAQADSTSPWSRDGASALRLVDAGATDAPGVRLAAISIQLDPGWKTYWRQPGASGVPPRFDFSGSTNLADATVGFPAPERQADEDGVTNVYHGLVILPVTVRPKDPSAPVELKLTADYGVCEAVCVPVRSQAELALTLGAANLGAAADEARGVAAMLPKPSRLGEAGPLAVSSVRRVAAGASEAAVEIEVAAPAGGEPLLFAETGDGDFAPAPERVGPADGGRALFRMTFEEPELPRSGLRLTLAAGGKAVEAPIALDAIGPKP